MVVARPLALAAVAFSCDTQRLILQGKGSYFLSLRLMYLLWH
jgi:hypothetical protein